MVFLRHPGYGDNKDILLKLPALDAGGGIHHETARIACCIVANNRWDGFLTENKAGTQRVDATLGPDDNLLKKDYYFHIPGLLDCKFFQF